MSALKLVTARPSTLADRAAASNAERARIVAEAVEEFMTALASVHVTGLFLAGLDGAAPGVRDLARRAGEDACAKRDSVLAIMGRVGR